MEGGGGYKIRFLLGKKKGNFYSAIEIQLSIANVCC